MHDTVEDEQTKEGCCNCLLVNHCCGTKRPIYIYILYSKIMVRGRSTALSHISVAVISHWKIYPSPQKDRWLRNCVHAITHWSDEPLVQTVDVAVFVNGVGLERVNEALTRNLPLPASVNLTIEVSALRGYMLTRSHLSGWANLAQDPSSRYTAFVYLEDDIMLTASALRAWDIDEQLLRSSGASDAGFHRGFFRYEISARGRYVLDERRSRRWNSRFCATVGKECRVGATYCASHPFVRVQGKLFVALHNPYFAATIATKAHVAAFVKTRGWNLTRYKSYSVREFAACGIHYYDHFAGDLSPVSGWWSPKERQDARRILVPVRFFDRGGAAGFTLVANAGLHHMSNRYLALTKKDRQGFSSFRENETLRCVS